MNSTNNFSYFNNSNNDTVSISVAEYKKLLEYKAICKEIYAKYGGDGL